MVWVLGSSPVTFYLCVFVCFSCAYSLYSEPFSQALPEKNSGEKKARPLYFFF